MRSFLALPLFVMLFALRAHADTPILVIKDGVVSPSEITFMAGEEIKFSIQNLSSHFEGFQSEAIHVEIGELPMNGMVTVSTPSLTAGTYPFTVKLEGSLLAFGEDKKIHGKIVVK